MSVHSIVSSVRNAFAILCIVCATGCGESSPSDAFVISEQQLDSVESSARAGDVRSMKQLIAHYGAMGDSECERLWQESAIKAGDPEELHFRAARIAAGARAEQDIQVRLDLLEEALELAQRAAKSDIPSEVDSEALVSRIRNEISELRATERETDAGLFQRPEG